MSFWARLLGLSEVQWQWKKRAWKEHGIFSWRRHLQQSPHPALTLLVASLLAIYGLTILLNGGNPLAPFDGLVFQRFGFALPELIRHHGETWRLLTAVFVHFNLWHILFNAIALYQVGQVIESEYGSARFFLAFLLTGLAGNIFELASMPSHGVLGGASGGVFGLIGFCGLYAHRTGNSALRRMMFQWALYSFVFGFFIGAANLAHFGGFAAGIVLGFIIPHYRLGRSLENRFFTVLGALALVATGYAFYQSLNFWRGSTAWETCYELIQADNFGDAVSPCRRAKNLLPTYPETEENWNILQEILQKRGISYDL